MRISIRNLIIATCALFILAAPFDAARAQEKLLVFVPASMTDVMQSLVKEYEGLSNTSVRLSIAGTAQLARQIDNGAPADVFISADAIWIKWLTERKRLVQQSITVIAGNELVVAVRNETENWADPKALLTDGRFAMADPQSIPAGRYAKQAMTSMGIWTKAQSQAVFGENVRVTLRQLALGEVGAAIVYATDVAIEPAVKSAFVFPDDSYDEVQYFAAAVDGANRDSGKFVEFLLSRTAQDILKAAGFKPAGTGR